MLTPSEIAADEPYLAKRAEEWRTPREWADRDHEKVRDEVRKQEEGYETGRHNEYSREMWRRLRDLADKADKRGELEEYGKRLREIAETYGKRAQTGHPGGQR